MRRWNGWGDDRMVHPLEARMAAWLAERTGQPESQAEISFEEVVGRVPETVLPDLKGISADPADRARHTYGQSLPDWVAMRRGTAVRYPEGIAYPESDEDLQALFTLAKQQGAVLIPYGGGTSVVGGIAPEMDGPPAITVDLSQMSRFISLDVKSRLATFGAGIKGPDLEAALRGQGHMLGHFPQSFELSTLGGWIATRSSGQQSLHYGRIEDHFAGGRLVMPEGILEMPPFPASAAGPDLREWVLGSEGRMGIISRAIVRVSPVPEREEFHGAFFPDWKTGVEAVRRIVQAGLPLSMLRLSNATETETNLMLAGHEKTIGLLHKGVKLFGQPPGEKCMLLFGITGSKKRVRQTKADTLTLIRRGGGIHIGQMMGRAWEKSRFRTPYLRNTLWERGFAADTVETIVPWSEVEETAAAIIQTLQTALDDTGERVFVFAHLSHLYPTGASIYITFIFRVLADPEEQLAYWQRLKDAASRVIVAHGGTISHQHGVGRDHAPYLEAEKGTAGLRLIGDMCKLCDPDGIMNPGKLIR